MMVNLGTVLLVIRSTLIVTNAFLLNDSSCKNRCGSSVSGTRTCACNTHCTRFNDCCSDYNSVCVHTAVSGSSSSGSCSSVATVTQELWDYDENAFMDGDYRINYQSRVAFSNTVDRASSRLFTSLYEAKLKGPTYTTFFRLLNNYQPAKGLAESKSSTERSEENAFLDAILNTEVMDILLKNLICRGVARSKSDLKAKLNKIWFDFYPRSNYGKSDTSGFEHVMVGEFKANSEVNGFHNWLSFYQKEKSGELEYYGYVDKSEPNLIGAAFKWKNHFKNLGSFFYGVSPEFDIAIYSLCFLLYPDGTCPAVINGRRINIKSHGQNGHLATIYPDV